MKIEVFHKASFLMRRPQKGLPLFVRIVDENIHIWSSNMSSKPSKPASKPPSSSNPTPSSKALEDAFDRALRPLYAPLCRYAAKRVGAQDAEDVVQQALLAAWNARDDRTELPSQAELIAWLRRFVDYACASRLRALFLHPEEPFGEEVEKQLEQRPSPPPLIELQQAYRQELYRLVQTVPLTQRQRYCLCAWLAGQSQFQIAATLRVDTKTVWDHLDAATRKLKRAAISEKVAIMEAYYEDVNRSIYRPPESVGARLAREKGKATRKTEASAPAAKEK